MITPAQINFTADGTPFSEIYGDVYHNAAGGLGQSQHVFIAGNGLPQRWQGRERFVIVETGFGFGLNFLTTWAAWKSDPQRSGRLHFISFEKHPFRATDLPTLHHTWPELAPLATQLQAQWPTLVPAQHRLYFDDGRIVLDLIFGDAEQCLPQLTAAADAFYLDGFAPAKNPALWTSDLLGALSKLSAPGATLATWSVAGSVREALSAQGWELEKTKGFAGKREMLRGTMRNATTDTTKTVVEKITEQHAIVIGAGLAGSIAANRLAARGWRVTVIDAKPGPGEGASGNRAGVLRPLPSRDDNQLAQITRAGYLATRRHLQILESSSLWQESTQESTPIWDQVGVLHLARDKTHEATQKSITEAQQQPADYLRFVQRDEATTLCGWPVDAGGWWFPGGGWVSPAAYCQANLRQFASQIKCHFSTQVAHIKKSGEYWRAFTENDECIAEAPQLVFANANDARRLIGDWLPVYPARGQVSHLPELTLETSPESTQNTAPHCVVCRLGYVTPAVGGSHCTGATFTMQDPDPTLRVADHSENLTKLRFILPGYGKDLNPENLDGRVGFRPTSPDRLPLVGAVPRIGESAAPPGLWLIDGFGARGIVWSAMAGELLADCMENSPRILGKKLANALAPARFLDRTTRKITKNQPQNKDGR